MRVPHNLNNLDAAITLEELEIAFQGTKSNAAGTDGVRPKVL